MKEKIEALGAKAYIYERDMAGGDVIMEKLLTSIDGCREAIVLISSKHPSEPAVGIF